MAKKKELSKQKRLAIIYDKYDRRHMRNLATQKRLIDELYVSALNESILAAIASKHKGDGEFNINDYPATKKRIDNALAEYTAGVEQAIVDGNQREWMLSVDKNAEMVKTLCRGTGIEQEQVEQWCEPNLSALEVFQKRKDGDGMQLSDRVWKIGKQMRSELELALDMGIGQGKTAQQISRDVRHLLNQPNKLFRRVRDERGQLRLSKAAAAYHTGRGVYRSSYKNALRLTATENNMAYRQADSDKWNQLNFVIGYNVDLSNNHTLNGKPFTDICDKFVGRYPKTFVFKGWHPHCRCIATPILADWKEQLKVMKMQKEGKDVSNYHYKGEVKNPPAGYTEWIEENADRIRNASAKPYFIRDNYVEGDIDKGFIAKQQAQSHEESLARVKARQAARTPEDIEKIQIAWDKRKIRKRRLP